jgi:microcystin-dependent protein
VGSFNTVNTTTANVFNGSISTLNAGAITTSTINAGRLFNTVSMTSPDANITSANISTLGVGITATVPALTGVTTINALPIDRYLGPPVGTMIMWGGSLAPPAILPAGYLLCVGVTVPIATYSALYSVIGDSFAIFGPAPAGQFTLPDMRGKAAMGATWIGQTGGSFQIRGADMANLGNPAYLPPIDPATGSPYARNVVLVITTVEGGQILTVGQTVTLPGYGSNTILGIINYRGQTDADTNNLRIVLIMSGNYPGLNFTNATFTVTSDLYNVGKTHFGNYTIQEGKEVGIHTHGTVATGSSAISAAANQRSEPTFSQPINQPNATFTIDGTQIISPYSMKTMPNACFANFLIKT